MKQLLLVLVIMTAGGLTLSAQSEEDLFGSEDELFGSGDEAGLFGGDSLIEEASDSETAIEDILLTDENGITIGGSFALGFTAGAALDPSEVSSEEDVEWSLTPDQSTRLYFDARPDSSIRVFGSADVSYPFTTAEDDPDTAEDESRSFDDIIHIRELFSDFNIDERVFIRAGKQTVNWGVGYYYSPADLLNLSEIDPENPDEELEGPLSVKMNLPSGINNYYLYAVSPDGAVDPSDIILAPKAEFVVGDAEIGFGGYYRYDQAPALMSTFTKVIRDIDVYGEAVVKYGSDKTFIEEDQGLYSLENYSNRLFFLATLGGAWTWSDDESDLSVSLTGQYYFNGEGYSDRSVLTESAGRAYTAASLAGGDLALNDLTQSSMHYCAGGISITPVEDFSLSVYWMGNFTDFSGLVKPGVNWNVSEYISLALNLPYSYGDEGDEYTPGGDNLSVSLEVSLGGVSF